MKRATRTFLQFINESRHGDDATEQEVTITAQSAAEELSPREKEILADYLQSDPAGFEELVSLELEGESFGANPNEMSDQEFRIRSIIDKIITRIGPVAGLAIVPAAMFISGGVALGLGITAVAAGILKDAAWYKSSGYDKYQSGHYYRESDRARHGGEERHRHHGSN